MLTNFGLTTKPRPSNRILSGKCSLPHICVWTPIHSQTRYPEFKFMVSVTPKKGCNTEFWQKLILSNTLYLNRYVHKWPVIICFSLQLLRLRIGRNVDKTDVNTRRRPLYCKFVLSVLDCLLLFTIICYLIRVQYWNFHFKNCATCRKCFDNGGHCWRRITVPYTSITRR
jgi:hypothetical protein